jgi:hypothetical protein
MICGGVAETRLVVSKRWFGQGLSHQLLARRWLSPALATCRRKSGLSPRPASRVLAHRALEVAQLGLHGSPERALVAASFIHGMPSS